MTEQGNPVRFGLAMGQTVPWPELVERWQEAEALGFDTVWLVDHFISGNEPSNDSSIYFEAWAALGGLAMATSRIRFGIMVNGNTYRNPALLAKQAVTVDHISNGRLELGIGAGWWEREHAAYGYEFPGKAELVARFREALEIIDSLQSNQRTDYHGQYYFMNDAPFEPKSLQTPRMPIVIGASGDRMLALTAKHADVWNTRRPVEIAAERSQYLDEQCRKIGRDPRKIVRSIWPGPTPWESLENVCKVTEDYRAVGFTDLIFTWPEANQRATMHEFAREVMPGLR